MCNQGGPLEPHPKVKAGAGTPTFGVSAPAASHGNRVGRRHVHSTSVRSNASAGKIMARPSTKPRVPELDPEAEALALTRTVLAHQAASARTLLGSLCKCSPQASEDQLRETPLYTTMRDLARYAVHGTPLQAPVSALLEPLAPLATGLLWPKVDVETIAANVDPNSETNPIKLLIAAALAREQLEQGKHLVTSAQLAVLSGLTRRHLGQLVRDGDLETETTGKQGTGGTYLVRPSVARKWLAARGLPGFSAKHKN